MTVQVYEAAVRRLALAVPACGRAALTLFHTPFDAAQFTAARFSRAIFAMPPSMAAAVPKRQAEFFHGRLCAGAALAHLGLAGATVGIGPRREPLWPSCVAGSITHSHGIAAAVAVPKRLYNGVGIDIEAVAHGPSLSAIASVALSASERARLATHDAGLEHAVLLTLAFSAKESFYKAVYETVQRFLNFDVIELVSIDAPARRMRFRVVQPIAAPFLPGRELAIDYALLAEGQVLTHFQW